MKDLIRQLRRAFAIHLVKSDNTHLIDDVLTLIDKIEDGGVPPQAVKQYPTITVISSESYNGVNAPAYQYTPIEKEYNAFMTTGQKIPAIKMVRERTGWGLREAKDAVEAAMNYFGFKPNTETR